MRGWARLPLILLICGLATTAFGADEAGSWLGLSSKVPAAPRVEFPSAPDGAIRIEVTAAGMRLTPVWIEGREYLRLDAPGARVPLAAGQPELPYQTLRLRIPDRGRPTVRIVTQQWREVAGRPLPSKGNLSRDIDPGSVPWIFGAAYDPSAVGAVPERAVRLGEPFLMRDVRGAALQIQLVRWDPQRDVLLLLERIELEVGTSPDPSRNELARALPLRDAAFEDLYRAGFDNFVAAEKYDRIPTRGRMLVVCPEAFAPAMQDFVRWKRQRGIPTDVVTVEEAGGTVAGIQAAIDQRYAEPEGLTYVVLVGDLEQVPTYLGDYEGAHDDTRYGRVAGDDYYPDLLVSRISARDETQVLTQTNKFITYERDPEAGGRWYARAAGIASDQGVPTDAVRAGWLREDLLAYGFSEVDEIYAPTGTTADIAEALNEGRSLVNYLGHGSGASWSNPYFNTDHVDSLANGARLPWILDVSCNNGDFERIECFAEAWLRAGTPEQAAGAVGMYSASTTTPWVPPTVMQAEAIDLLTTGTDRVLGALCTHGMMEVLDTYPGDEGLQLVEQYNLFGDCSLEVRAAEPQPIAASHPSVVSDGGPAFVVEAGAGGLTAALSRDGVLYAAGRTDPTGTAELQQMEAYPGGGLLTLTVTGRDRIPYFAELPILPAEGIYLQPETVPVGQTTEVALQWIDPQTGNAQSGQVVEITGLGTGRIEAVTDETGRAVLPVLPRFGETLRVTGREPGDDFVRFEAWLPVSGAAPLASARLEGGVPGVGLIDTLAANLEAVISGSAAEPGLELFLDYYDTHLVFTSATARVEGSLTPPWPGTLTATLAQEGCTTVSLDLEVIQPVRVAAGRVLAEADGSALHRVRIAGYPADSGAAGAPVFEVETDLAGYWITPTEIPIGGYELHLEKLGYVSRIETVAILPGSADLEHRLQTAPHGLVSGTVAVAGSGEGLFTLVEAFRADTGEKFAHVWSAGEGGAYTLPALPYFEYDIQVSPLGYTPQKKRLVVDAPTENLGFALEETSGRLLLVDAGWQSPEAESEPVARPARLDKTGEVLSEAYAAPLSRSAVEILGEASLLGYEVGYVTSTTYDAAAWGAYDLVLVSCGDESGALDAQLKGDLLAYVAAGGKLLIEGGDVARDEVTDGEFARDVLHVSAWVTDEPGDVGVYEALHPVMGYPHALPPSLELDATGAGSADAVTPTGDAVTAGSWTNSWADASVVCFGPESLLGAGQTVFFAFDYGALDPEVRRDLLHNAVHWLVEPEAGRATISGAVSVVHAADDSGVSLRLDPGGRQLVTGPGGSYLFDGLYAGNYTLTVTKPGWSSASAAIALTQEQQVAGLDFELTDVQTFELHDEPGAAIPDNDPEGAACAIHAEVDRRLSAVAVYLDLTHPYLADLVIDLVSPSGRTVRLHQHNGADGDDLLGWYPDELVPYGILDALVGEEIAGDWTLRVVDEGPWDAGTVNAWGLRFTYAQVASAPQDLPRRTALLGNRPNPFNPATNIEFELGHATRVRLEIFDVAGRRVATLIDESLAAGRHTARWTGRDDAGRAASAGTYFYRLSAGTEVQVGKMSLVK